MTAKNNEQLLSAVFKMMDFSNDEISDVGEFRQKMASSASEEVKKEAKKGLLGMFAKKGSRAATPSPMKPIRK